MITSGGGLSSEPIPLAYFNMKLVSLSKQIINLVYVRDSINEGGGKNKHFFFTFKRQVNPIKFQFFLCIFYNLKFVER